MMTLDQIKEALKDRRMDAVSDATGIHYATISRIKNGHNDNPTYSVLKSLSDYLTKGDA